MHNLLGGDEASLAAKAFDGEIYSIDTIFICTRGSVHSQNEYVAGQFHCEYRYDIKLPTLYHLGV